MGVSGVSSISTVELEKAVKYLPEAVSLYKNAKIDIEKKTFRDPSMQRFEFLIELSWKTLMKILGSTTAAAKNAVREMARNNLIEDPTLWIGFIEDRNKTSYSCDEDVAMRVCLAILNEKIFTQLKNFGLEVFVFESRRRGKYDPFSDIDILLKAILAWKLSTKRK